AEGRRHGMAKIKLAEAETIAEGTLKHAAKIGASPLTVVVLDDGGHPVLLKRQDNSGILRHDVALGKAWGALGMGRPSRELEQLAIDRPYFMDSVVAASSGRVVPVKGGVLVANADGDVIGAVGISGDTSEVDEACAAAGIAAAGFTMI
ncbi:MAG: GlcG/HbpS family heme-binding protein, partial [Geminicoccaceae bacterium]